MAIQLNDHKEKAIDSRGHIQFLKESINVRIEALYLVVEVAVHPGEDLAVVLVRVLAEDLRGGRGEAGAEEEAGGHAHDDDTLLHLAHSLHHLHTGHHLGYVHTLIDIKSIMSLSHTNRVTTSRCCCWCCCCARLRCCDGAKLQLLGPALRHARTTRSTRRTAPADPTTTTATTVT